jgi:glycosyltransferase involved in cell wall biosynthesis
MRPLVSIIIPCYNTAQYLGKCFESIESQTLGIENIQIIIVDDASTDSGRTWGKILEFEKKHPKEVVAVHLEQNRSQGGARNEGLKYAEAAYVGYLDSDDWIEPDMYERLYKCISDLGCDVVDCCYSMDYDCGIRYINHKTDDVYDNFDKSIIEGGIQWPDSFEHKLLGGGVVTRLSSKKLLLDSKVRFPEHMKYEDNYWGDILALYIRSYYHMSYDGYHYRIREDSTVHASNSLVVLDSINIQEMIVAKYKELGLYDKYRQYVDRAYIDCYCRTLLTICGKFDNPPYNIFNYLREQLRQVVPSYKSYMNGELRKLLLMVVDKKFTEREFIDFAKDIVQYYKTDHYIQMFG